MTQYMVKYVCVKFYQIVSNVRSKVKISRGSMPLDPLVCHMLCTRIHTCPLIIHTIPFAPPLPGKKLKETLMWLNFLGLSSPLLHTASDQKFAGGGLRTRLSKPKIVVTLHAPSEPDWNNILNRSVWASLRFEWWVVQFLTLRNWWLNWRWLSWRWLTWVLYNGGVPCKKCQ